DIVTLAEHKDSMIRISLRKEKGAKTYQKPQKSIHSNATYPKRKKIYSNATYNKGKTIKRLSEGEKERLRKGGQCFFCKEKGHTFNSSKKRPQHHQNPMKPHQTPASNYTRITAHDPHETFGNRFPTSAHTRNDSENET